MTRRSRVIGGHRCGPEIDALPHIGSQISCVRPPIERIVIEIAVPSTEEYVHPVNSQRFQYVCRYEYSTRK